jgi:hypothetical protein
MTARTAKEIPDNREWWDQNLREWREQHGIVEPRQLEVAARDGNVIKLEGRAR